MVQDRYVHRHDSRYVDSSDRQSDIQRGTIDPATNQVGGLGPEHADAGAALLKGTRQGTMTWYNIG